MMKKHLYALFAAFALLLCFGLGGCTRVQDAPYKVTLYSGSDSLTGANLRSEYDDEWLTRSFIDKSAPQEMTVKLGDRTVTGRYLESDRNLPNNYQTDIYQINRRNRFMVDEKGNLVGYIELGYECGTTIKTEAECVQIARDYIGAYCDLSGYEAFVTCSESTPKYRVEFCKMVRGFPSSDSIFVYVAADGHIGTVKSKMFGRISTDLDVRLDQATVDQAIAEKVDSLYESVRDQYDEIEHSVVTYRLTQRRNKAIVIFCNVKVYCITQKEDGTTERREDVLMIFVEQT